MPRISPLLAAPLVVLPPIPIPDPDPGIGPMLAQLRERALDPIRDLEVPADLIDLDDWYLTLPTGEKGAPDDVHPPALGSFAGDWFRLNDARDGTAGDAGRPAHRRRRPAHRDLLQQPARRRDPAQRHGHFKAGCYSQSDPERDDDPDAMAEVIIYSLKVEHAE